MSFTTPTKAAAEAEAPGAPYKRPRECAELEEGEVSESRQEKVAKITAVYEAENPGFTIVEVGASSAHVDIDYADSEHSIVFVKMNKDGTPIRNAAVDLKLALILHPGAAEAVFNGQPLSRTVLNSEWVAPTVFENFQGVLPEKIISEIIANPMYAVLLPHAESAYVVSLAAIGALRYYCFGQAPNENPGTRLAEEWDVATWEERMNEIRASSAHLQSMQPSLDACVRFNSEDLKYELVFERKLLDELETQLEQLAERVGMAEELLNELDPSNRADMARFVQMRNDLKTHISHLNSDPLAGAAHHLRAFIE
jgi:hypothetical protein